MTITALIFYIVCGILGMNIWFSNFPYEYGYRRLLVILVGILMIPFWVVIFPIWILTNYIND